ncbi:rRNA maturation RNase YbeY [candidate division WOR-3 bacterium]|nr:rRNA maturation RNase YbeY [candidate division WOR-3 bacterium]
MLQVEIFGTEDTFLQREIRRLIRHIHRLLGTKMPEGKINIIFVNNRYIHRLNRQFLGRDRPTDVLSFRLDTPLVPGRKNAPQLVGEIYISREQARLQAKQAGIRLRDELLALVEHGLLHLAGLSHAQMKKLN